MSRPSDRPPGAVEQPAYQSGFGNEFASEALPGALPVGRNAPQHPALGLFAEQLTGSAFTAPRDRNRRSWLYRIRPAAAHAPFEPAEAALGEARLGDTAGGSVSPNQMRWSAAPIPAAATDFIAGLQTMAGCGDPLAHDGCALYRYAVNRSMQARHFYSADGEWLLVPQQGALRIVTELGVLDVEPQEVAVVPRGVRFRVELRDGGARGYACENFGAPFRLPDLGPIGANGLANPRDFLAPVAAFEDREGAFELLAKMDNRLWRAELDHSPIDVVAWHGNYYPYKYDLRRFNTLGSVSYDHPDPSIYLVLQAPGVAPGFGAIDFVIFPPRWLVAQDTFRPPYFHRNLASEFMGLIHGVYDAKAAGFEPGGASLHNSMAGHGPDAGTLERATAEDTGAPRRLEDTLAFMFESRVPLRVTPQALASPQRQDDYPRTWQAIGRRFCPGGAGG